MSFSTPAGRASPEIQTVTAWHEALNSGDVESLLELSHFDVEMGGPRGKVRGAQTLRDWTDRAGIHLEPGRIFHAADTVVVEQEAEWFSAGSSSRQTVASTFVVRNGLVTSVVRYPSLAEALRAANLDERHAVA
jgi:ketosteroid isomerase-like protein